MSHSPVQHYWRKIAGRHDAEAFGVLDAAYREAHRGYHDWRHIADLLSKLSALERVAARPDLIAAAIFWHDSVYRTRTDDGRLRPDADNVRESAALFARHTTFEPMERDAVVEMIMATIAHLDARAGEERYPGFARDLDLFLDLDLSSLAAPWPEFVENLARIRFEYAWVPEKLFVLGRLQMVQQFAARAEDLYRRSETRALWSAPAAANLARGAKELGAQLTTLTSP